MSNENPNTEPDNRSTHDAGDEIAPDHRGHSNNELFEKMPNIEKVDKFGSHAKTDPYEIALVKRLDRYMLVRFSFHHDAMVY